MYYLKCYDSNDNLVAIIDSFIDLSWTSSINTTTQLNFTIPRTEGKSQHLQYGVKLELWKDNSLIRTFYLQSREIEYDTYRYTALGPLSYLNRFRLPQEFDFSGWSQYDALSALLKEYRTYTLTWKSDWDNCTRSNVDTSSLTGENWFDSVILAKQPGGNYYSSGYIITPAIDLGADVKSAYLRIQASVGARVGIRFKYRTSDDRTNWGSWSSEVEYSSANKFHQIPFSPKRYVQVQCTLWTDDTSAPDANGNPVGYSPVLNAIQIVGVYDTIFSNVNIPNSLTKQLKNISFDQTTNMEAIYDLCKQEKLEISDSFSPKVASKLGEDKTNSVLIHESKDITVFQLSDDFSECENYIYAYGGGDGIDKLVVIVKDDESIAKYGKRVGIYENGQCVDKTQLQTEAQEYLNEHKYPKQSFRVEIANWKGESFDLGDVIRFKSPTFDIDGTFRVVEITRNLDGRILLVLSNTQVNLIDFILAKKHKPTLPPPKPIDLRIEKLASGQGIKLYYKKYSPYVEVFKSTDGITYQSIGITSENEFTDTNVSLSKVNYYKVRGRNPDGSVSDFTDTVSILANPSLNAWSGVVYSTFFDSIDGFSRSTTGTAYITLDYTSLTLGTGSTSNSQASIIKAPMIKVTELTWAKSRRFITAIEVSSGGSFECFMGVGNPPPDPTSSAMMFRLIGDGTSVTLYGYTKRDINEATVQLVQNFQRGVLEALCVPETAVYFFVNGTNVGTITSVVPGGTGRAPETLLYIKLTNTSAADTAIKLSEYHFVQEA